MKRNLILVSVVLVCLLLIFNSTKRILAFRTTSQKVGEAEAKLEKLKKENADLKRDLEYKKSNEFAEEEIRNKLGLAKKGEVVFVVPKKDNQTSTTNDHQSTIPNYLKWWNLFFGS